jgi:acetoacetyl-CoA synthetase
MGKLLWSPTEEQKSQSEINKFKQYVENEHGLFFPSYQELWAWSTTELASFWKSIAAYFNIKFHSGFTNIVEFAGRSYKLYRTKWFAGATLNYAEHVFRNTTEKRPALIFQSEQQVKERCHGLSWNPWFSNFKSI